MNEEILRTKIRNCKGVLQFLTSIYFAIVFISYRKNQDFLPFYIFDKLNLIPDISNLWISNSTQQLFLKRLKKNIRISVQPFGTERLFSYCSMKEHNMI